MKTKIDTKWKITTYQFDKFPTVILSEYRTDIGNTSRHISAKVGCLKRDYLKELTLMRAKYPHPCDLPYSIDDGGETFYWDDDCVKWAQYLSCSHSGQSGFISVPKEKYADFEADVNAIDFRVFDQAHAESIAQKYTLVKKSAVAIDVDAVAIEESMNEAA